MRASAKRLAILAAASVSLTGLMVGCERLESESAQADRRVEASMREGQIQLRSGGFDAAIASLDKAVGESAASAAAKARANSLLGQAEYESATALLEKVNYTEIEIARMVWDLDRLANRLQSANAVVASSKNYDPKALLAEVDKNIAAAKGGSDKATWSIQDDVKIPTLNAVTGQITRLNGEVAKIEEQIKSLVASRMQVLSEADKLMQQSEADKGQKAVDEYTQAAEQRKKAAQLAVRIDAANAALVPLKNDLSVAQGQEKILNEALAQYEQQKKQIAEGWAQLQKQAAGQAELAKSVLASVKQKVGEAGGQAKSDKAPETLAPLLARAQADRKAAIDQLNNAIGHFGTATTAAEQLKAAMNTKLVDEKLRQLPEAAAWKTLQEVYDPSTFRLQQAIAQHTLATAYANQASNLSALQQMSQKLTTGAREAGLSVPKALQDGDVAKSLKAARTQAMETFKSTDETLGGIVDVQGASANGARTARILSCYAWSQACKEAGDTKAGDEHLTAAKKYKDEAIALNTQLPPLPAELGPVPGPKLPAPASQPVETGATTLPTEFVIPGANSVLGNMMKAISTTVRDSAQGGGEQPKEGVPTAPPTPPEQAPQTPPATPEQAQPAPAPTPAAPAQ